MCLAVPGVIEEIDEQGPLKMAKVNFRGAYKEACIEWVPEAKVGDYVVVHAGFALNIVSSPVKGLIPFRAFVAGFRFTSIFMSPGKENFPTALFLI